MTHSSVCGSSFSVAEVPPQRARVRTVFTRLAASASLGQTRSRLRSGDVPCRNRIAGLSGWPGYTWGISAPIESCETTFFHLLSSSMLRERPSTKQTMPAVCRQNFTPSGVLCSSASRVNRLETTRPPVFAHFAVTKIALRMHAKTRTKSFWTD